jgi:hypothetical protein
MAGEKQEVIHSIQRIAPWRADDHLCRTPTITCLKFPSRVTLLPVSGLLGGLCLSFLGFL